MILSIVIPVYNGASGINPLWGVLKPVLGAFNGSSEVIFVDDGSSDGSLDLIKTICCEDSSAAWIQFAENRGQQAAVLCGLRHCRGDWVVTIDDDLQHPPEFIPVLHRTAIEGGFDAVYAVSGESALRPGGRLRDAFFSLLLGKPSGMRIGSYRIFSREAVEHICRAEGRFVYISAELFRGDFYFGTVAITEGGSKPAALPSRYGTFKRFKLYLRLVLWYTPVFRMITRKLIRGGQYDIVATGGAN